MKKFSLLIMLFALIANNVQAEKPKVVATASMIADIAQNIGKEHIAVSCIVPIGGDPHLYKPTPGDAKMVVNSDLILKNGLTFEGWLDELIENSGTKAPIITVTDGVAAIKSLTYDSPDPHAWMDVTNGIIYAKNIADALSELLPDHAQDFENNFIAYRKQLQDLDEYITQAINKIPKEKRILITSHDAFQYYGKRYQIQLESVLGTSTDADIQTDDVLHLQKIIKESQVPVVFIETTVNPKVLKQIAEDNGISIGGKLLSDSLGDEKTGGETYLKMLKQNTDIIVKGLSRSKGDNPMVIEETSTASYIFTGLISLVFIGGLFFMYSKNR